MISKQMHSILKKIPHAPTTTNFENMTKETAVAPALLKDLLTNALANKYIAYSFRNNPYNNIPNSNFSLTELGQIAVEEYEGTKYNSKLSVWALIIAGLSFLASVAAIVVSCVVQ